MPGRRRSRGFLCAGTDKACGRDYILVTESLDEEEGEALILKDVSSPEDPEAVYETVEEEQELDAVASH